MGFDGELEGESLAEVTTDLLRGKLVVDESLPLVVTGRAPWRTDIEARGVTVTLRTIPIRHRGERVGAIVLVRDVTEVRHQEQELITKDATIREIHHRVKNNLQTVASLLRIQSRRAHSDVSARRPRARRCAGSRAIAVVHDTLSEGLSQNVDFDDVFDRVLMLIAEVASSHNTTVRPGQDGQLRHAAERVRDAAGAGADRAGDQRRRARPRRAATARSRSRRSATTTCCACKVRDNGVGLPEGKVGSGLGTQIVRTLIQGELGGTIDWHTLAGRGHRGDDRHAAALADEEQRERRACGAS